jgi:hypothetical protein
MRRVNIGIAVLAAARDYNVSAHIFRQHQSQAASTVVGATASASGFANWVSGVLSFKQNSARMRCYEQFIVYRGRTSGVVCSTAASANNSYFSVNYTLVNCSHLGVGQLRYMWC